MNIAQKTIYLLIISHGEYIFDSFDFKKIPKVEIPDSINYLEKITYIPFNLCHIYLVEPGLEAIHNDVVNILSNNQLIKGEELKQMLYSIHDQKNYNTMISTQRNIDYLKTSILEQYTEYSRLMNELNINAENILNTDTDKNTKNKEMKKLLIKSNQIDRDFEELIKTQQVIRTQETHIEYLKKAIESTNLLQNYIYDAAATRYPALTPPAPTNDTAMMQEIDPKSGDDKSKINDIFINKTYTKLEINKDSQLKGGIYVVFNNNTDDILRVGYNFLPSNGNITTVTTQDLINELANKGYNNIILIDYSCDIVNFTTEFQFDQLEILETTEYVKQKNNFINELSKLIGKTYHRGGLKGKGKGKSKKYVKIPKYYKKTKRAKHKCKYSKKTKNK